MSLRFAVALIWLVCFGALGPAWSQASGTDRKLEVATFAGGCFWCTEADFDKVKGVVSTISGYMGGSTANPTYQQVTTGRTGHAEVVQITFDPSLVSYKHLVDVFWRSIDPLDAGGQFCDRGNQYRTAIFYHDDAQKEIALASKQALENAKRFDKPIATEITQASAFTQAEGYHQDFYKKNPGRYLPYRAGCRRDARIEQVWGSEAHMK